MKRHSWGELVKTPYTKYQQCLKCGLYRFDAIGIWFYSKEPISVKYKHFLGSVPNIGCIIKK